MERRKQALSSAARSVVARAESLQSTAADPGCAAIGDHDECAEGGRACIPIAAEPAGRHTCMRSPSDLRTRAPHRQCCDSAVVRVDARTTPPRSPRRARDHVGLALERAHQRAGRERREARPQCRAHARRSQSSTSAGSRDRARACPRPAARDPGGPAWQPRHRTRRRPARDGSCSTAHPCDSAASGLPFARQLPRPLGTICLRWQAGCLAPALVRSPAARTAGTDRNSRAP